MEQEEEKNIIIEFQRKVLQEANCTAEMLAYLDEIDDDVFREYYCICALDGMTVEEIRRIDSIAVQDWRVKIKHIKEERLNFLENIFVPNSEMQKQISELHDKAGKVFQETEELELIGARVYGSRSREGLYRPERLNGVKGIGIDLHFPDDDMYSGKCDLLAGGRICREMLDAVPRYKENREVRKAVKYLENHFNKKEELSLSKPKKQEQAPRL